jgi:hypothetical protein
MQAVGCPLSVSWNAFWFFLRPTHFLDTVSTSISSSAYLYLRVRPMYILVAVPMYFYRRYRCYPRLHRTTRVPVLCSASASSAISLLNDHESAFIASQPLFRASTGAPICFLPQPPSCTWLQRVHGWSNGVIPRLLWHPLHAKLCH